MTDLLPRVRVCNPGLARSTYIEGVIPRAVVEASTTKIFKLERHGFPIVPVEKIGLHGFRCIGLAHLRNDQAGATLDDRLVEMDELEAATIREHVFEATDWVRDRIGGLVPQCRFRVAGAPGEEGRWYRIAPFVSFIDEAPLPGHKLEQRWHITGRCAEYPRLQLEAVASVRSGSDEIEIVGTVRNSLAGTEDGDCDLLELELVTSDLLYLDNWRGLGFGQAVQRKDLDHDVDPPMLEFAVPLITKPVHLGTWQGVDWRGAILAVPNDTTIAALLASTNPTTAERVRNLAQRVSGKAWFLADFADTDTGWLAHRWVPRIPDGAEAAWRDVQTQELSKVYAWLTREQASTFDSRPIGTTPNNNGSGDQQDFGLGKVVALQSVFDPGAIPLLLGCVSEGLRPTHFRELNGARVERPDHPLLVFWSQVPHWHRSVSQDQLGKPVGVPAWTSLWQGKDKQHLSSNLLAAVYAATGDWLLRQHIEDELAAALLDVPGHIDSPRGQGRPLHMLANTWLLTGDAYALHEIADRVERGFAFWQEQNPWCEDGTRPIRVLGTLTDPRTLTRWDDASKKRVPVPCWSVWEHGLAFEGYSAAVRALRLAVARGEPYQRALELGERLCLEIGALLVRGGFFQAGQTWTLAANVRIEETPGKDTDPELYQAGGADGVMTEPGFWEWCIGAVGWFVEELPNACASKIPLGGYTTSQVWGVWERARAILEADRMPNAPGASAPSSRSIEWRRCSRIGAGLDPIGFAIPILRARLTAALAKLQDAGADNPKEPKT